MADLDNTFPRISARKGQIVDLSVDFLHNGIPKNPYAIRSVEIYKSQVLPHNLVATIPIIDRCNDQYPVPLVLDTIEYFDPCGTESGEEIDVCGKYHLPFTIPEDFVAPDVYFDVWYFYTNNPCPTDCEETGTDACDIDDPQFDHLLQRCCHRFWVYPNEWFCNDDLQTVRFGFEPLDQKFNYPEVRPLEVGLMPLPLYDYNFNLVNPMIPFLKPTITIETQNSEVLVKNAPCRIGIRQGSYRSNPWVIKYDVDTSNFLKGTYTYQILLHLPDGSSRASKKFIMSIN